jgi:hypothetical protein
MNGQAARDMSKVLQVEIKKQARVNESTTGKQLVSFQQSMLAEK